MSSPPGPGSLLLALIILGMGRDLMAETVEEPFPPSAPRNQIPSAAYNESSSFPAGNDDLNCPEQQYLNESLSGAIIVLPCHVTDAGLAGIITFTCTNGQWTNHTNCYLTALFNQFLEIQNIINDPDPDKLLPSFLQTLADITVINKEAIMSSPTYISLTVNILSIVSDISRTVLPAMMDNFITIVNTIVDEPQAWTTIRDRSSDLLSLVERFAGKLRIESSFESNKSNSNIQLKGQTFSANTSYNQTFQLSGLSGGVWIGDGSLSGNCTVVSIAYSTLKDILPSDPNTIISGLVISTKVVQGTINQDHFNVSISFSQSNDSPTNSQCVFWDFNINNWNQENCSSTVTDSSLFCNCNHLTSFSVLTGDIQSGVMYSSRTLFYIGKGFSLACMVITLVIEAIVWKSVTKSKTSYLRHVCLVNIALLFLVEDIAYILPLPTYFLIFFSALAQFFWMLNMGLLLFYRIVFILHDCRGKTMVAIAFCVGYGCPALISIVPLTSLLVTSDSTSDRSCWIGFYSLRDLLAFILPAFAIVFVNLIILLVVIFKLLRPNVGDNQSKDKKIVTIQIFKSLAVLTPLLGLTSGLNLGFEIGSMTCNANYIVWHMMFSTLMVSQRLFILISGVLLDQKVRAALRNTLSCSKLKDIFCSFPCIFTSKVREIQ